MEPYLSELRVFAFGNIPRGFLPCNGQLLPIAQNQALFSLLGTTYGGNGVNNFALPDLRGTAMIGYGGNYPEGSRAGSETVTLTINNLPAHNHQMNAQSADASFNLTPAAPAETLATPVVNGNADNINAYFAPPTSLLTTLNPATISPAGSSAPHNNMPPFLAVNVCIATQGIFPSRN